MYKTERMILLPRGVQAFGRDLLRGVGLLVFLALLTAPPASAVEKNLFSKASTVAASPKIDTRILQRDETLLESEVRIKPGGDAGHVLWTRIDVSDSKGNRVRSKIFGSGLGVQAYPFRLVNPAFREVYRISVISVVKPLPSGPEIRISAEKDVIIRDDDLKPPAIVIEPGEDLERPDSWDTEFRWTVTDRSGLDPVQVTLFRDGTPDALPGEPEGSFRPLHPGSYRMSVRAEDRDNDRPGDRLRNEKLSTVMDVFDDDDDPPVLDVRFPERVPNDEPFLAVDLLASDPSGISDIRLLYEGEEFRPPTGGVYEQGETTSSLPLTFRLVETSFEPLTFELLEQGFRISLCDADTDGPAGFRVTLLSEPVVLESPTASGLGYPGEDPYLTLSPPDVVLDLEVQASEFFNPLLPGSGNGPEDREGGNSVEVFHRINRGPWVSAFRMEGSGSNPFIPKSVPLPVLPDDEIQIKVVYEGEINAFFSEEYKELRVARAAVNSSFPWQIVEHGPVELRVPDSAGVHSFIVQATDGDDDREGDASFTEEVYFFSVPDDPVSLSGPANRSGP